MRRGLALPRPAWPRPAPARSRGRTRRGWGPPTPGLPGSPPASPRLRLGRQQTLGWVPGVTTRPGRSEQATGAKGVPQPGRGRGQGYPRGPSPGPGHERRAASAAFRAREGERAAQAPRELAAAPQVVAAGTGLPASRARLQPTGNWRPKAPPVPGVSPAARPPAERSFSFLTPQQPSAPPRGGGTGGAATGRRRLCRERPSTFEAPLGQRSCSCGRRSGPPRLAHPGAWGCQ